MNGRGCQSPSLVTLAVWLGAIACVQATLPSLPAQEAATLGQGTHLFRHVLHESNLEPVGEELTVEEFAQEPDKKLLIVLGQTNVLNGPDLKDFVERGGAVLVATDRNTSGNGLAAFGVQVVGQPVRVRGDSAVAYKGLEDCIFVESTDHDPPLLKHLTDKGNLTKVATNRPGYLKLTANGLALLATFPRECWIDDDGAVRPQNPLPFAVGGQVGKGRILVLSDHSVFINAMLWQNDNDNLNFTHDCIDWLTEGGKRNQVLFVDEGKVQTDFNIPLKQVPPPPVERLVEAFNRGLRGMEEENWFNHVAQDAAKAIVSDKFLPGLVILLTIALGVYGLSRLSQDRHRLEPGVPLLSAGLAQEEAPASVLKQRYGAMAQEGNFWEAARALARQGWETTLSSQPTAAVPPRLRLRGAWWSRWRLRRIVYQLWQVAYGTEPVRISSRRLARLSADLKTVQLALSDGRLQLD